MIFAGAVTAVVVCSWRMGMNEKNDASTVLENAGLSLSVQGLRGRQSVRATFRLPDHIIRLLGIVASQLGLKQKSLFDQLVEDMDVLNRVAERARELVSGGGERRQKTFVLSRRSLEVIDKVARTQNIPRDVLVEISIRRLLPVMNAEQEKHRKRTLIYREMEKFADQCKELVRQADRLLGREDRAYTLLKKVADVCEENVTELGAIVESGRAMEDYGFGK